MSIFFKMYHSKIIIQILYLSLLGINFIQCKNIILLSLILKHIQLFINCLIAFKRFTNYIFIHNADI